MFKIGQTVRVVGEPKGSMNEFATVTAIGVEGKVAGKYHVSAMNMPWIGTLCKFMSPDEIEARNEY